MKFKENMSLQDADKIIFVKVNGKPYKTYIDGAGVQRFVANSAVKALVDSILEEPKSLGLHDLAVLLHNNEILFEDWLEFYTMFNYSVAGFCDVIESQLYNAFTDSSTYNNSELSDEQLDVEFEKFCSKHFHIQNPLEGHIK